MTITQIIILIVIGLPVLFLLIRVGLLGLVIDILLAIFGGKSSKSGGGFGGGSSAGGSSDDW